jgi:hypothetical protein
LQTHYWKLPIGATTGRKRAAQIVHDALQSVTGKIAETDADRNRTARGKAIEVHTPFLNKVALPHLLRAKRDVALGEKRIAQQTATLRKKAIGEPKATDPIWLNRLWEMQPNKRAETVLTHPAARAAALREPDLAGVDSSLLEHAIRRQIQEFHERGGAQLEIAKEAQEVQRLLTNELEKAVMSVPALVAANGAVRPFVSSTELARFVDAQLPGQASRESTRTEEIVFDQIEEAA